MNRFVMRSVVTREVRLALLAVVIVGCAAAPMPPATEIRPGGANPLDGRWFETPGHGLGAGSGSIRIEDGKLRFETTSASGTLTLHEDERRRVLRGEGLRKDGTGTFPVELTQRK